MRIDAHQHFWRLERGDYGWLTPDLRGLYRDFMPDDLIPLLQQYGIHGTVLVQAAPTAAETAFLLQLADDAPFVRGVVGWADFAAADAETTIALLAAHPKLVGLRPMIQDIANDDWMLQDVLTPAFEAMIRHDLVFDALVLPHHLERLNTLVQRHPALRVVIDHGAKPAIAHREFTTWAKDIAALASQNQVHCKLSGLLTEAGAGWTDGDLQPYIAHMLACFGAERLIWGSDWPVLTQAASYDRWLAIAQAAVGHDPLADRIFGANALDLYRLRPASGVGPA